MTLDQLKYFHEAARYQHVGKAAKTIHISPSAISAAISALEAVLGVQLFDRVGKSILLTESGKRLQKESELLFDQMNGMKLRVTGSDHHLSGQYRIGGSHFLATTLLTRAWNALQKESPALVAEICSLPTFTVISDVVAGALDLGLCFSPLQHPNLHQEIIYRGQLKIAVRKNHPLAKLKLDSKKAFKLLSECPAVIHKAQPGVALCEFHPIFNEFGIEVNPCMYFDNDLSAIEKLLHSNAWALMPETVIHQYSKKIIELEVPKNWDAPFEIVIIMRRDRMKNALLLKASQAIKKNLAN